MHKLRAETLVKVIEPSISKQTTVFENWLLFHLFVCWLVGLFSFLDVCTSMLFFSFSCLFILGLGVGGCYSYSLSSQACLIIGVSFLNFFCFAEPTRHIPIWISMVHLLLMLYFFFETREVKFQHRRDAFKSSWFRNIRTI